MPRLNRVETQVSVDRISRHFDEAEAARPTSFDPDLLAKMREIAGSGLNPSNALDLLIRLIAEVPAACKEEMEQIKIIDKLLNTCRSMMETRLKNEEAQEIAGRLAEMEIRLERMAAEKLLENKRPTEVWHDVRLDK
jgi:hypothetical protein